MKNKIQKLNKTEYFSVYGLELLSNYTEANKKYLLELLLPIAKKYYKITNQAVRSELRHLFGACGEWEESIQERKDYNLELFKKLKIKKFQRKKIDLSIIEKNFNNGSWLSNYGGKSWGKICAECIELKNAIEKKNFKDIIFHIDRLNDLEHNNALYLVSYTTFDFEVVSYDRTTIKVDCLFKSCSEEIQWLAKEYYI